MSKTATRNESQSFINLGLNVICLINSIQVIILDLVFLFQVDYVDYMVNAGFTFLFYPLFFLLFKILNSDISFQDND